MENSKQPKPKKGEKFTGWAVYNWGVCLNKVFRTRKDAIEWCLETRSGKHTGETWKKMSKNHAIVKVKCYVL